MDDEGSCVCYERTDTRGKFWEVWPFLFEAGIEVASGRSFKLHKGVGASQLGLLGARSMGPS